MGEARRFYCGGENHRLDYCYCRRLHRVEILQSQLVCWSGLPLGRSLDDTGCDDLSEGPGVTRHWGGEIKTSLPFITVGPLRDRAR